MKLTLSEYRDKVLGCWTGKNIGGVLGAPYEAKRQLNDISFYAQDLSAGPPPNDDLDLQMVWLMAVEKYGRNVNASILGEYWLSYIVPNWAEYGIGKANLKAGLVPPLSGYIENQYRNSCGCFIRSELWACLAPGHPEIAVRYAYEDGIVDHAGEGVLGEVFCAALESAAFAESDQKTLIDIALSYIPADSAVARCVKKAVTCYESGFDLAKARKEIHNEAPGTFGVIGRSETNATKEEGFAMGEAGFDAPENVAYVIAGWLYGEGDFGDSLCKAVAFGEDTDCTAATLGALLGILKGASNLPEKWVAPINDKITTLCIDRTTPMSIPATVTELSDRLMRATPMFLGAAFCDVFSKGGYTIETLPKDKLKYEKEKYIKGHIAPPECMETPLDELLTQPTVVRYPFSTHSVHVDAGEPFFSADVPKKIRVQVVNPNLFNHPMWCRIKAYAPEGVRLVSNAEYIMPLNVLYGEKAEAVFEVDAAAFTGGKLEILFDVSIEGRHTATPVKVVLFRR